MRLEEETGRKRKEKELPRRRRVDEWKQSEIKAECCFTEAIETKGRQQIEPCKSDGAAERRAHCRDLKTFHPVPELPVLHRLIKQGNEAL